MRANIGFRSTVRLTGPEGAKYRRTLTAFQSAVLQHIEENGDGYGAVVAGNYYTEASVRGDVALAEQLYWIIGE